MRLDNYLVAKNIFDSRTKAQQAISRGEIFINNKAVLKSSFNVDSNADLKVEYRYLEKFVSLGGYKLKKALEDFRFSVNGLTVADIGSSTGGFTDCLLKNGAKKVFAVDLNDNLLHESLKSNQNVVRIIKNAKELTFNDFNEPLDLIVADLSFISIQYVIDVFASLLNPGKKLIVLIKPQFETGQKKKFKNGIIKDKKIQMEICKNIYTLSIEKSLTPVAFTTAPVVEGKNLEFLMMFEKDGNNKLVLNI